MSIIIYTIQSILCVCAIYYCYKCCLSNQNYINNENELSDTILHELPKYDDIV